MPSNLYFTAVVPTVGPTPGTKATYLPLAVNNVWPGSEINSSFTEVAPDDTNQQSRQCPMLNDIVNTQSYYLGRFCTLPLDAQTIPAQTWDYRNVVCGEWNSQCNTFHWPVIYVWRPSTSSVVGYCLNASGPMGVEWAVTPAGISGQTFAGAAVTCQQGDILVCEFWAAGKLGMSGSQQLQWLWTQASNTYILSPYKLVYYSGPVGANTPSTADTLNYEPMVPSAATATITRRYTSNALPMTYSPMTPTAAASGVVKVYNSVADPMTYAPMVPADATATERHNYTSIADPATYATTPVNDEEFFSGITYLYLIADPSPITITGLKANPTFLPRAQHKDSTGSPLVDGSIDTYWGGVGNTVDRTISTFANLNPQSHYFGRFVSRPLAAQTIPPQTWNYSFVVGETNAAAEVYFAPVIYVYRPSNNSVVGHIFDGSVSGSTEWPATTGSATRNFTSVGPGLTIQDGDVLVIEAWAVSTQTVASAYTIRWRMTDNTSRMATQYKLLYAPSTILFFQDPSPSVVPTAGSKVSATYLPKTPTGTQHTAWTGVANEGRLSTTMIQAPVGRTVNSKANTSPQSFYFGRHSSAPLSTQTIPAQLWEWGVSCGTGNANAHTFHWPVLYTYRPSDQSVRFIMDGSGPQGVEWRIGVDPLLNQRFAGAAVDVVAGDILVCEVWAVATQTAAASYVDQVWTTAQNSWLTSPYVIQFYTGTTAITSVASPAAYDLVEADTADTVPTLPLMEALTENFEAALDTGIWTPSNFNGTVTFTGGVGNFSVTNGISGAQAEIFSKKFYDLRNSKAFTKLVKPFKQVADPGTADFSLGIMSPGDNTLAFAQSTSGYLRIIKFTNGAWGHVADITFSYFAEEDTYRWLQIREQDGTTYFESAPGTASNPPTAGQWVVRHSAPTNTLPVNFAACQYVAWIYTNAGGTLSQAAQIDGLNTATAAAVAAAITSVADPFTFAPMAPSGATSTAQSYSTASPFVFAPLVPLAATSTVQDYSTALPLAFAPLVPVAATSSVQNFSSALPSVFAFSATATGLGAATASTALPVLYAVSVPATTGTLNRVVNASPGAFSQGLAANTTDLAGYYSQAGPTTYTYGATATTTNLGRVYSSVAAATGYAQVAAATGESAISFSVASPLALGPLTAAPATANFAAFSTALPTSYSYAATPTTVSLGRVYSSAALPTSFFANPLDAGYSFARASNAVPGAYSLGGVAATSTAAIPSAALQANYTHSATATTTLLGRVYTSVASPTTYSLNETIQTGSQFARVSSASSVAYSVAGAAATSGVVRIVFSSADPSTYAHTAQSTTAGVVRNLTSNAASTIYFSFPQDAAAALGRSSVALPYTYSPLAGTTATSGFARSSTAIEASYVLVPSSVTVILGRTYSSVALPAAFVFSPGFPGDAVARFSAATGTVYSVTGVAATAYYSKNSLALPANYAHNPSDTQSGRVTFSTALPAGFSFASPATNSYVPGKVVSIALPPTFLLTATASSHRRGYASAANRAPYVLSIWDAYDKASNEVKKPINFPLPSPMSVVTDAQFESWLNDERAIRVVLIETKCVDPVTNLTEAVYFASRGFVTKLEDGPNPVFYAPLLRGGLEFAQSIDLDLQGNQSYGDIELDNTEGDLDWMFDRVWPYKEFKAYIGDATWPRRDFRQMFDGTIEDIDSSQRDTVNVRLRDKLYRLDMPVTDKLIGGIGPNANQLVPVTFGECHNVTPVLSDVNTLTYLWHPRSAEKNIEIRDNGIPVAFTEIVGGFKLAKQPFGRITCTVQGDRMVVPTAMVATGLNYVNTVAELTKCLVTQWGTTAENRFTLADIDIRNFTVFDARNKAPVGLYATERTTVLEACQNIAGAVGGRLTMTALGKAQLVKLRLPPDDDSTPVNLQYNGDFSLLLDGWTYNGGNGGIAPDASVGVNLTVDWTPPNINTFYAHQQGIANNPSAYFEYIGKAIPVEPGKQYTVSAYTGAHRARVAIFFNEYNEAGAILPGVPVLPTTAFNNAETPGQGGTVLAGYKRIYNSLTTASTTAYVRVVLRKYDTISGNTDSWMFVNTVSLQGTEANVLPTIVVTESDMVAGSLHIADRLPLVAGARLGYCKNWTVQEDTASGVPEDHKSMYAREWLTVAVDEATEQENCLLLESYSANNECNRRVALRATQRHVYEFVGFARLMFTPVGAAMKITHRRFNLSEGKTGQVISVAVNWLTSQVTIKVLI